MGEVGVWDGGRGGGRAGMGEGLCVARCYTMPPTGTGVAKSHDLKEYNCNELESH